MPISEMTQGDTVIQPETNIADIPDEIETPKQSTVSEGEDDETADIPDEF